LTFISAQGTFKKNIYICINIEKNNTFILHSLTFIACKRIFILVAKNSLSQNDNHLHFRSISLQEKTFNNTICMRTNIQLHYYATISMKVTTLNAARHALLRFHLTLRDISPIFLEKERKRKENWIIAKGTICTFFKIIISQSSPCRYKFRHLQNFLVTTQRVHYSIQMTCSDSSICPEMQRKNRNRIQFEHCERIIRAFVDVKEDYLLVADTLGINKPTARSIVSRYVREGQC